MLVAVDIGNTHIVMGFLHDGQITHTYRMSTNPSRTSDEIGIAMAQFLSMSGYSVDDVDDVILCSVVPHIMHSFKNAVEKFIRRTPIVIGPGIKTGINIRIDDPKSLGADCLVDCVAAYHLYGPDTLVIDMGTATTFNYVDVHGAITMGIIQTGLQTSARALAGNTAQLPEVEITRPSSILATNTHSAIQAGLYYAFLGGIERVITQCRREINDTFKVVATGGLGRVIENDCSLIDVYDPDLIFKGMHIIYEKNKRS